MSKLKEIKQQNLAARKRTDLEKGQADPIQTLTESQNSLQRWMNILVNISRRIANLESMDTILLTIVRLALRILRADVVALVLWNEDRTRLDVRYLATKTSTEMVEEALEPSPLLERLLFSCNVTRFPEDLPAAAEPWTYRGQAVRSGLVAPMCMDTETVGGLLVICFHHRSFSIIDSSGIKSLAEQATIALEHAVMKARLQSVAVLEERSRIAREMHDCVVQILGYLGMEMLAVETLVRLDDQEKVLEKLKVVRDNIQAAQADARENILSLRTTLAGEDDFIDALQKYVEAYGHQAGMQAHWCSTIQEPPRLSPLAEVQLVRIVQEALTNVRKHARAAQVWVNLDLDQEQLVITVRDDGIGFKPDGGKKHFGLQTMLERARSVGGSFSIKPGSEQGTEAALRLPLMRE